MLVSSNLSRPRADVRDPCVVADSGDRSSRRCNLAKARFRKQGSVSSRLVCAFVCVLLRVYTLAWKRKKNANKGDKTTESVKRRTWFRHRRLNVWLALFFLSFVPASVFPGCWLSFLSWYSLFTTFVPFFELRALQTTFSLPQFNRGRLGDGSARRGSRAPLAVPGVDSFLSLFFLSHYLQPTWRIKNTKRRELAHTHTCCTCTLRGLCCIRPGSSDMCAKSE